MAAPFLPQKSSSKNSRSRFSDPETIRSASSLCELPADKAVVLPFRKIVTLEAAFPLLLFVHPDKMSKTKDNKRICKQLNLKNFIIAPCPQDTDYLK
jgi:hypothetical protein